MTSIPLSDNEQELYRLTHGKLVSQLHRDVHEEESKAIGRLVECGALNGSSASDGMALGLLLKKVMGIERLKIEAVDQVLSTAGKAWDSSLADAVYRDIADSLDERAQALPSRIGNGAVFGRLKMSPGAAGKVSPEDLRDVFDGLKLEVRRDLDTLVSRARVVAQSGSDATQVAGMVPAEIRDSLAHFRTQHPDPSKTAFIMMQFGKSPPHVKIASAIKKALEERGIIGLRADDEMHHDDLYSNVLTYLHGCGFGVAVFERIETDVVNPNVSLEVGYMLAMDKPVCLLKDKTLKQLQADLVGKLYREFDPHNAVQTIGPELHRWLTDKELG